MCRPCESGDRVLRAGNGSNPEFTLYAHARDVYRGNASSYSAVITGLVPVIPLIKTVRSS